MYIVQWPGIKGRGLGDLSDRGAGEYGRVGELTHTQSSVWGSGTGREAAEDVQRQDLWSGTEG